MFLASAFPDIVKSTEQRKSHNFFLTLSNSELESLRRRFVWCFIVFIHEKCMTKKNSCLFYQEGFTSTPNYSFSLLSIFYLFLKYFPSVSYFDFLGTLRSELCWSQLEIKGICLFYLTRGQSTEWGQEISFSPNL